MSSPIPLAEAQQRLLAGNAPLPAEIVAVEAASGRYLADPLIAHRTQPPADLSAMDGYALRSGGTGFWRVIGESAAGHPFAGAIGPGEAIRISTGALMPEGADAVLLQENASREGDLLSLNGDGEPAQRHIRRKGFDFRESDVLLPAGTRIGPGQLALAITAGHARLAVHRQPSVAILDCGDELSVDPTACAAHQIPASNGAMLAAMCTGLAGEIVRAGPVSDELDIVTSALERASEADVIVTSGGASVGDHDLLRPALTAWGAQIDFWRVAMKPGKPLLIARKGKTIVLGLPGNPVSSYVTAFLFLLPLLRRLAGADEPCPRALRLPLGAELSAGGSRVEFVRAHLVDGALVPLGSQDSSGLGALAISDALIRREIGTPPALQGEQVAAYLLQNGGSA